MVHGVLAAGRALVVEAAPSSTPGIYWSGVSWREPGQGFEAGPSLDPRGATPATARVSDNGAAAIAIWKDRGVAVVTRDPEGNWSRQIELSDVAAAYPQVTVDYEGAWVIWRHDYKAVVGRRVNWEDGVWQPAITLASAPVLGQLAVEGDGAGNVYVAYAEGSTVSALFRDASRLDSTLAPTSSSSSSGSGYVAIETRVVLRGQRHRSLARWT